MPGDYPKILIDDKPFEILKPLNNLELVLCYIPLLLIFAGGAIGGACGGLASFINVKIARKIENNVLKIICIMVSTLGVIVLWLIIAVVISVLFN